MHEARGESSSGDRACAAHGPTPKQARRTCCSRGLTFELNGPMRWTAGPAWCSITERTTQALTAAVAGPLERGVRPERAWVNSIR